MGDDYLPKGRSAAWIVCAALVFVAVKLLIANNAVLAVVAAFGAIFAARIATAWDKDFSTTLGHVKVAYYLRGRNAAWAVAFLMLGLAYILVQNGQPLAGLRIIMGSVIPIAIAAKWNTSAALYRSIRKRLRRQ